MKLSDSKYDNRSTSGSEYFKQRFTNSDVKLLENKDNLYAESNIKQIKQINSEYEIFEPSQKLNLPARYPQNLKTSYGKVKEKVNPFLSSHYSQVFRNRQDKVHQSENEVKQFKSNQSKFTQMDKIRQMEQDRRNQSRNKFQTVSQSSVSLISRSHSNSVKESLSKLNKYPKIQPKINQYNQQPTEQPKQPSYSKCIKTYDVPNSYKNYKPDNLPKLQSSSQFPQLTHDILEHIYFTIAHESDITQVFKAFINQQKQMIDSRFQQTLKQISNAMYQIKTVFYQKVDHNYHLLLQQLKDIKNMAQIMWKGNHNHQKKQAPTNPSFLTSRHQKHGDLIANSLERQRSGSKYCYKKLSQQCAKSPQSNQYLLHQLYEQDQRLNLYKNTKEFYFDMRKLQHLQEGNNINTLDRQKFLKDIFKLSCGVGMCIKQCQNEFYDAICNQNGQKHKTYCWLNQAQMFEASKANQNCGASTAKILQIRTLIDQQLIILSQLSQSFRKNLNHTYLQ